MKVQAVCFDLDGTLLDPGGSIRDALDHTVSVHGLRPFAADEVLVGMPLGDILRTRTSDPATLKAGLETFRTRYVEHGWYSATWYPGVRDVVASCRDAGLKTAIVTTKSQREAEHLFDARTESALWDIIIGDDDVRPLKPDPAPVVAACGEMGLRPDAAIMVGDTCYDIDAGRAAGAYTIGVTWGTGGAWGAGPDDADVLVDDAAGLWKAIQQRVAAADP